MSTLRRAIAKGVLALSSCELAFLAQERLIFPSVENFARYSASRYYQPRSLHNVLLQEGNLFWLAGLEGALALSSREFP